MTYLWGEMILSQIILEALSGLSPSPSPATIDSELSSTASSYSSFAGIFAGFSFTALAIYLGWHPDTNKGEPSSSRHIARAQVAAALFYAMVSLAMCSFLYASISAQAVDAVQRVPVELLLYGIVFGVSVLTLFYSLTLMMYENSHTKDAAGYAYWAVVIVGPIIVLSLLINAANSVWQVKCTPECPSEGWLQPVPVGIISLGILLMFSVAITVFRLLYWWEWTRRFLDWLYPRPTFPAVVVFIFATCMTVGSLLITVPISFTPSSWFAFIGSIAGAVILAVFALACGCVIGPRVNIGLPGWLKRVLYWLGWARTWNIIEQRAGGWDPDSVQRN